MLVREDAQALAFATPQPDAFHFDLVREPWIPCERRDGSPALVGLDEALVEAHTLAAVHDESPLATATLHRVLLAILHRVFAPRTIDDWLTLWEEGRFDAGRVRAYFETWRGRFDLFHVDRPFLQVGGLEDVVERERGKAPEATVAFRLSLETSQHSAATQLFEPEPPDAAIEPAHAARALLGYLAFTPGGRIQNDAESRKSGNLRGGAVVLLRGSSLHETLLLNLIWKRERPAADVPPWERVDPIRRAVRSPYGLVDHLVWPSRRVRLVPTRDARGSVVVRDVVTAAGEDMDGQHADPMFGYVVRAPKRPPFAVRIDRDRSAWRDAGALFDLATGKGERRRPLACDQLAELISKGAIPRSARFSIDLLGLASNQASIRLWRAERMPLPPPLLVDGPRMAILRRALGDAEELGAALDEQVLRALSGAALAPGGREAHKGDVAKLSEALGAMTTYWGALGARFPAWLERLGRASDIDRVLATWRGALRDASCEAVRNASRALGTTARALQAGAMAERELCRVLADKLPALPAPSSAPHDDARPTRGAST